MEYTMLKAFCRSGNLKSLLKSGQASSPMSELQGIFWRYFGSMFLGAEHSDISTLEQHTSSDVPHITEPPDK